MTRPTQNTPGDELLPRPPGVFRRWLAAHPRLVDGCIVGCYLFGCALVVVFDLVSGTVIGSLPEVDPEAAAAVQERGGYLTWPWVLVSALIVAVVAVALAYRRRFPLAGVAAVSLLLFFEQGLLVAPNSVAIVFLLYAVPVYRGVRSGWIALGIAVLASSVSTLLTGGTGTGLFGPAGIALRGDSVSGSDQIAVGIANGLWLLAVLMIGINLGNRRRYVEALIDRAHQLAREREQRARLAAAGERARIAREMHDIVAHSLSVVVTLSEAAAVAIDTRPDAAKHALERSAETGRQALIEMRRLLGVLNDDSAELASEPSPASSSTTSSAASAGEGAVRADSGLSYAPQPGLMQLPELVSSFADAGLDVSLTQEGSPTGDAQQQLAVYRIVQEGLTNALRYAGRSASVEVTVAHAGDGGTRIAVIDSGPPGVEPQSSAGSRVAAGSGASTERWATEDSTAAQPGSLHEAAIPGSGRGLAGSAARARMFGGSLDAGPHGRGWRLAAVVPSGSSGTSSDAAVTSPDAAMASSDSAADDGRAEVTGTEHRGGMPEDER